MLLRTASRDNSGLLDARAIRSALGPVLAREHRRTRETVIVQELGLKAGRVVADVVVVNGEIHGLEIKSDLDSLRRLDRQIQVYGETLDRASIVVGEKFASRIESVVPEWWGIFVAQQSASRIVFNRLRRGRPNNARRAGSLVQLLWREDAADLLREYGALGGLSSRPRKYLWEKICEVCSLDEIAARVRVCLKHRFATGSLSPLL